jgi:hypothetical protein
MPSNSHTPGGVFEKQRKQSWFDELEDFEQETLTYHSPVGAKGIFLPQHHSASYKIMAVGPDSFLHLARPLAPAVIGVQPTTAPLNVIIQPPVRFPLTHKEGVH